MSGHAADERGAPSSRGKIVVISGPSGSGKTTVCDALLSDPNVTLSVSATTRSPRPGERDGVHYHFLSREQFRERAERSYFAEHAEYDGELYGTPREPLEKALAEGRTVLVEIDVQGAAQLRSAYPDGIYIFLDAPGRDAAMARLERRNTETPQERSRRMQMAERERETAQGQCFDYTVINDDLDQTVAELRRLILGGLAARTGS